MLFAYFKKNSACLPSKENFVFYQQILESYYKAPVHQLSLSQLQGLNRKTKKLASCWQQFCCTDFSKDFNLVGMNERNFPHEHA